jgi:hypothetical protein
VFIELVDSLRCPRDHEDSWLVATVLRRDDRRVIDGVLGCPVCLARFPVQGGVAHFGASGDAVVTRPALSRERPSPDAVIRAAALLDLVEPGGIVVLGGEWGRFASSIAGLAHAQVATVNAGTPPDDSELVSALIVDDRLPFRAQSIRAMALDAETATPAMVGAAASVLRSGARVVLPASHASPDWARELARDEEVVVAEREAVGSRPVGITRRRA